MKAIGITRASRDPMGAWDFIEWLFTPDIAVLYHQNTGSVPSRNDLTSRITKSAPHLAGWYQAVKYGFVMEAYGSAWNRNRDLVLQALMGRIDARSALAQINGQYQMALDDLWATSGTR